MSPRVRASLIGAMLTALMLAAAPAGADEKKDEGPPPAAHPQATHPVPPPHPPGAAGIPKGPGPATSGRPGPGNAAPFHPRDRNHVVPRQDFSGRDYRHLDPDERAQWQGGHWHHDSYGGRYGWWWDTDGYWYFYPAPIYPYPDSIVTDDVEPAPALADEAAPEEAPAAPGNEDAAPDANANPAPAGSWYYCAASQTYYPYARNCPGGWTSVPARPADAP